MDRDAFAAEVTAAIEGEPLIELRRDEVTALPADGIAIVATGPLTSEALAAEIARLTGSEPSLFLRQHQPHRGRRNGGYRRRLLGIALRQIDRWNRRLPELPASIASNTSASSTRCSAAEAVTAHIAEDDTPFFEACLPIEELARRGRDTLRFGPMKPMGLTDPRTGRRPWAVVQLRQENLRAQSFNLVGFQNHLKFGDQARILRMIPGLENAEFLRFGQIHRNTYINAPALLTPTLQLRAHPRHFLRRADFRRGRLRGSHRHRPDGRACTRPRWPPAKRRAPLPRETALGSLCHYISGADPADYQPANITFDLLPPLDEATRLSFAARQEGAPRRDVPPRARGARRMDGRRCLSSPGRSIAISRNWRAAVTPSTLWTPMAPTCASFSTTSRRRKPSRPRPAASIC